MKKQSAIFTAAFVVLALFGAGCGATDRDAKVEPAPAPAITPTKKLPSPSAPGWATNRVAEITSAPNAFIGKTVTVVAEVDDVYSARAFTLDAENEDSSHAKGAGEDLLALVPKVGGFPSVDAQWKDGKARVTGVVQRMIPKDVEREIGWVIPLNLESRFRGRAVLIARSVERLVK